MEAEGPLPRQQKPHPAHLFLSSQKNPVRTQSDLWMLLLGDKINKSDMWRNVARTGEKRNAYKIFVGKPEGKKPSGS
jgi:hypothetical protein